MQQDWVMLFDAHTLRGMVVKLYCLCSAILGKSNSCIQLPHKSQEQIVVVIAMKHFHTVVTNKRVTFFSLIHEPTPVGEQFNATQCSAAGGYRRFCLYVEQDNILVGYLLDTQE